MKNFKLFKIREGFFALLFLLVITLSACTAKVYTPEIKEELETEAVCTFGDFRYKCKIIKTADFVSITPLETNAAGMTIRCNGKTVSFIKGGMKREFDINTIDVTNPAVVLYSVFSSLDTAEAKAVKEGFAFTGETSAGEYTYLINKANEPVSLTLNSARLQFKFINA